MLICTVQRAASPNLPLSLPTTPGLPDAPNPPAPPSLPATHLSFGFPPAPTPVDTPRITLPLLRPAEMMFTVYRNEAPETKLCLYGSQFAAAGRPGRLDWDRLHSLVAANLRFDDFREALVVNWAVVVEDQETLDKGFEMRRYVANNEVAVVAVDETGRPRDREVVERLKKGRRRIREMEGEF